jgi:transposase
LPERRELSRRVRSRTIRAEDARRARVIRALGSGLGVRAVAGMLKCSSSYVQRWRERFLASRLAGLVARHQGRKVRPDAAKLEARILEWTRRGPQDGTTQWSSRRLAVRLGTNHMTVSRIWARHGLQPHRLRRYMLSDDPDFEKKAADMIGLYLNPPDHAAVFCVDQKTAIQALDRLDPVLPLSPGRAEAHGFDYYRHGTLSLSAALDTRRGLSGQSSSGPHSFYTHLLFLAQPSRNLLRQNSKACHRSRHLFLRRRSPKKNPSLHPPSQQNCHSDQMELTLRLPNV